MEAFDQYKQKGYIQKLKSDIAPDIVQFTHQDTPSTRQDFVTLLYMQVTNIDGMYFVFAEGRNIYAYF
jgi:hypothetical protein